MVISSDKHSRHISSLFPDLKKNMFCNGPICCHVDMC